MEKEKKETEEKLKAETLRSVNVCLSLMIDDDNDDDEKIYDE